MRTSFHRPRWLLSLFIALLGAGNASAADVCPRSPQWGQVPNVWDGTVTQLRARYDGRWAGAAQVPLRNGDADGRVRFLEGTDGALYVAFEIDTTGIDRDVFWFGFAPASATDSASAWLLEVTITPDQANPPTDTQLIEQKPISCAATSCPAGWSCTQPTPCPAPPAPPRASFRVLHGIAPDVPGGPSRFRWDGDAFDKTVAVAPLISAATGPASRAWHGPLYPDTPPGAPNPTAATVVLRIPHEVFGGTTPSDQKVWVSAAACNFLGESSVGCAQQGNWPAAGFVEQVNPGLYTAPTLDEWGVMRRGSGATCAAVLSLASAGVQTGAAPGAAYDPAGSFTQQIHIDNNGNPADDKPNWFAARISVPSPTDPNKYRARFFIADWGSQIGNLSAAQWFEVGQVNNPGLPAVAPGALEHLKLQWPVGLDAAELKELACKYSNCTSAVAGCPYPSDTMPTACDGIADARTHHPHQCTQVVLEAIGSSSYQFEQDSKIFNTNFVGASVFWRVATISTAGIKDVTPAPAAAPPEGRDIYIHVRALNLPGKSSEVPIAASIGRLEQIAKAAGTPPPGRRPPVHSVLTRTLRERLSGGHGDDADPDPQRQAVAIGLLRSLPLELVRAVAPTLEFNVYYDTGKVLDSSSGKASKWLAPMTSFRYVVEHVGRIQGWEWALDGATPLGNNWFHLRIPDGGKKRIRTRVQAVEGARMPPGNPVWPPGMGWINPASSKPGAIKVKLKKRGCSVSDDGSGGIAGVLVMCAIAASLRRRRTARARA